MDGAPAAPCDRTAARVGIRIDGVDDASRAASGRAAREAVRMRIRCRTVDSARAIWDDHGC